MDLVSDVLKYLISKFNFLEHHYICSLLYKTRFFSNEKIDQETKIVPPNYFCTCPGTYF